MVEVRLTVDAPRVELSESIMYHSLDCSAIFEPAINDCAPLRFLYRKIYVKIILLNSLASASLFSRWVAYDNLSDGVQGHTSCLPQR